MTNSADARLLRPEPAPFNLNPLRFKYAHEPLPEASDRPLVRELIDSGTLALIYGESNTGKSYIAVNLAVAVALGLDFLGHQTTRGAVLYWAGEGATGLHRRVHAALVEAGVKKNVPLAITKEAICLDPKAGIDVRRVIDTVKQVEWHTQMKCELVVIDTLARSFVGDENSPEAMQTFVKACDEVRRSTGATVLVIHHAGKVAAKGARGHSSLRAAVDTELFVEGYQNPHRVSVTKQRDLEPIPPTAFDLEARVVSGIETPNPITACVVRHRGAAAAPAFSLGLGSQQKTLLAELNRREALSETRSHWRPDELRSISRELGATKTSARDAVNGIISRGLLVSSPAGYELRRQEANVGETGRKG